MSFSRVSLQTGREAQKNGDKENSKRAAGGGPRASLTKLEKELGCHMSTPEKQRRGDCASSAAPRVTNRQQKVRHMYAEACPLNGTCQVKEGLKSSQKKLQPPPPQRKASKRLRRWGYHSIRSRPPDETEVKSANRQSAGAEK